MTWLMNDLPDATLQTADQIRQTAEDAYNGYRSDGRLNSATIRAGIASAYMAAKQKMDRLRAMSTDQAQNARDTALRAAFGSPAADPVSIVAARDAADRAAQLGNDDWHQALDLLARADLHQDESLARAVAQRAWELGTSGDGTWGEVLDRFTATRPQAAQAIAQLASNQVKPMAGVLFAFILPRPPELASVDDWALPGLAAQVAG
jgi:hypothetical protein